MFRTGPGSDDSFMTSLEFEVHEHSAQLYVQVMEYSGREDLFVTVYAGHEGGHVQVARSTLGKYANALGPATLTKGKYRLVVHPDQDSATLPSSSEMIRFGLDVLLEMSDIGGGGDTELVVEEVELCSLPTLPDNFNGPGFIHPLSGNSIQADAKYRLAELLEGTAVKFELSETSLVTFYLEVPEGVAAEAALVRVRGTYTTRVATEDLNKGDETFLRQKGGFEHRGVIQLREFLDEGAYMIKIQGREETATGTRVMPRCEAYHIGLSVSPIKDSATFPIGEGCLDSHFLPEHLTFDEVKAGKVAYPLSESTVDVAYLDLKGDGEGPFLFFFQVQHDPRDVGVIGVSLSQYDQETSSFKQAALYGSPQDGIAQLFTVVESGTYAIGIQTLTSTETVFRTGGLGGHSQSTFGTRLLHETCLDLHYTYLVASTLRGDSRAIQGGVGSLVSLLVGGGLQRLTKQLELDGRFLDELGDPRILASCPHDDLPRNLPHAEAGFDKSLTLLVQEKPADVLDLVVEQESLLRVSIHSSNPKNQVTAFLYENSQTNSAFAWTTGSRTSSSLLHVLKPQKRAYRLRLEYESLDQDDPCPTFDLRVVIKPIAEAISENFRCAARPLPPSTIAIDKDDFDSTGEYSFPSDFITAALPKSQGGDLEYDVLVDWPTADPDAEYYFDVEARSDFLTGQLAFVLLYEAPNRELRLLGHSQQVGGAPGRSQYVERLKLLDHEGDLAGDPDLSLAVLRLRLPASALELLQTLKDGGHLAAGHEICHNFQLSVRAEKRGGGHAAGAELTGPSRLVRVRWDGEQVDTGVYDPRSRLTASLEFDRSMHGAYQALKTTEWASLVPEKAEGAGSTRAAPDVVRPSVKKLSAVDPSTIILQFPAGTLASGWCHRLHLGGVPGLGGTADFDEQLLAGELRVCASKCLCDWTGTTHCDEDSGFCNCRSSFIGEDCS